VERDILLLRPLTLPHQPTHTLFQDLLVPRDLQGLPERLDLKVIVAIQETQVTKEPLELMAYLDLLELLAPWGLPDLGVLLVLLVLLER